MKLIYKSFSDTVSGIKSLLHFSVAEEYNGCHLYNAKLFKQIGGFLSRLGVSHMSSHTEEL